MRKFKDEDKEIAKFILCKICKKFLTEPIQLPCSENICHLHLNDFIKIDQLKHKKYFDCVFCRQKHFIENDQDFILSKSLSFFSNLYSSQKYDFAEYFNECKELLLELKRSDSNSLLKSNYESQLIEYFSDLKSKVDLKREEIILEIQRASDNLLMEINEIEKDYLNRLTSIHANFNIDELKTKLKNYENQLNKYKIDLDEWTQINEKIKQDLSKLDQIRMNSNRLVSSKQKFKFKSASMNKDLKYLFGKIEKGLAGRLLSCSEDKSINMWDLYSGEYIQKIDAHKSSVLCLELLFNQQFASGSDDKTIKIWDLKSFECLKTLNGHSGSVYCLKKLNENEIISGSGDKTIKIWNLTTGDCLKTIDIKSSVSCLEITKDKHMITTCIKDKTIKIWNYENGECLRTLNSHSNWVVCLTLINNKIVSGSADQTIKIWNLDTGECLQTLTDHNDLILRIKSYKENQFISGSRDGYIKLWDIDNGCCLKTIKTDDYWIFALEVSEDGEILSGSEDKSINIWNMETGKCLKTLTGHSDQVLSLIYIS